MVANLGSWISSVFGGSDEATKNKTTDQDKANQANSTWQQDRDIVNKEWSSLLSESGAQPDPKMKLTKTDPFDTMSHEDLYNKLQGINTGLINSAADGWRRLSADARTAIDTYTKGVNKSVEEKWDGKSASKAVEASKQFTTTFTQLAATFQMVGQRLDLIEGYLGQAKQSVGKPDNLTLGDKVIDALPAQSILKGPTYRADEAENQARYVMKTFYAPQVQQVSEAVPVLPEPKSTTDEKKPNVNDPGNNGPSPSSGPQSNVPSPSDDPSTKPQSTDVPSTPSPASTTPQSTQSPSTTQVPTTSPVTQAPTGSPTTPASAVPTSRVPSAGTPRAGTGTPRAGTGTPGAGSPKGTTGTPKTVSGTPATTAVPGSANSSKAAAGTGRSGMPGMGGMGGQRANGEGDDEHSIPDYLIYDRGDELLGKQPPVLPPGGVIGG
ncbi:PPE domain-containing protein [Nocardia sp. NPDC051832]|uniref:PPE domain-containing protein n=1 Tax=Nocardia sp. NPDC051832 TaxID=3155673 RepID=UPI0034378AAE